MLILWIDDDPSLADGGVWGAALNDAVEGVDVQFEVISVSNDGLRDIAKKFEGAKAKDERGEPHLVLMDHNLNGADLGFDASGASLSHMIRVRHPTVAVACITAKATEQEGLDFEQMSEYVALFTKDGLGNRLEEVVVLARDYQALCSKDGHCVGRSKILDLFKATPTDRQYIDYVLPSEFSEHGPADSKREATPHLVARWILGGLLSRPGFLVDADEVSTMLGLKVGSDKLWSDVLDGARYIGIFANDANPKWWRSHIAELVFGASRNPDAESLLVAGRDLPGVTEHDFSRSDVHPELDEPPDCLAYTDHTMSRRVQTHVKLTREFVGNRGGLPGFSPFLVAKRPDR